MQMSTVHFRGVTFVALLLAVFLCDQARAEALAPFKDDLFSSPTIIESRDGGDFELVDYQEMRDINGRDQIPERRVKSRYVDLGIKRQQVNETLALTTGPLDVTRVGVAENAAFTVIFIHGRGGDRRLGANDYSFGGNFNRLKNLAVRNGGTYYAPTVASFDTAGVAAVSALIGDISARSPGKPVVLACASMGSFICWGVTRDAAVVEKLGGMAILGGATDPDFARSAAYKRKLPIAFTHGSRDSVYAATDQIALYDRLHKVGYPTRFTLFETGSHGTPVRMSDWRQILNWLLKTR
ncbi:alpha/beta hydrolase [Rhizobium daejeonense]|uniref:Alpha/beta hydrolase n=1 Tax=Rhizobium daejeonense TaxID=240521 RepID=A0A6M1RZF3_9HYPH|nr:alpha/beta hydrolase [Rhizobium daejeonense]NGO64103.1 alpha/beta hydrolase [Rhizobium daejeonense]